jgi:hypothetical protein
MVRSVTIPIRVVPEVNQRGGWQRRFFSRTKPHKEIVFLACRTTFGATPPKLPLVIKMTRISPGMLDDDNAVGAMKAVRDSVAQYLGINDRDNRVKWLVGQEKGKRGQYAVRIDVYDLECARDIVREA